MIRNAFAAFPMNACNFVKSWRMIFQRCSTHWQCFQKNDSKLRSMRDTQSLQHVLFTMIQCAAHFPTLLVGRSVAWRPCTKRTSAYWLDMNSLRRSNGRLARMNPNWKYTYFQYLETIQMKPLQAILENIILWTKKTHKQTKKQGQVTWSRQLQWNESIFWLSFSLKLHWIIYYSHIIN